MWTWRLGRDEKGQRGEEKGRAEKGLGRGRGR